MLDDNAPSACSSSFVGRLLHQFLSKEARFIGGTLVHLLPVTMWGPIDMAPPSASSICHRFDPFLATSSPEPCLPTG